MTSAARREHRLAPFGFPWICESILVFCLLVVPRGAWADMTYCYQGNNFTSVAGAYSSADSVRGCVTLAAALPEDSPRTFYSIVDFLFSDGEQTISLASPSAGGFFSFGTSAGEITSWDIHVIGSSGEINTFHNIPLVPFTEDQVDMNFGLDWAAVNTSGAWTTSPEPASFILLLTAAAAAGMVIAKKRLRAPGSAGFGRYASASRCLRCGTSAVPSIAATSPLSPGIRRCNSAAAL